MVPQIFIKFYILSLIYLLVIISIIYIGELEIDWKLGL